MPKRLLQFLLLAIFVVSATYFGVKVLVDSELKKMPPKTEFIRELSEKEEWQMFLYEEVIRNGLQFRDFALLKKIIRCESSWRQYWSNGEVIVSSGNVGLAQINRSAHEKTYKAMGLDVYNPYDNLKFAVWLYKTQGTRPWLKWSGHCWRIGL